MTVDTVSLIVFGGLPLAAVGLWWGRVLFQRLSGKAAMTASWSRHAVVHLTLLGPPAAVGVFHVLDSRGVDGPWTSGLDEPGALLLWWTVYAFGVLLAFTAAGGEADPARRTPAGDRRMELYHRIAGAIESPQKPRAALYVMLDHLMSEFGMQVGMVHLANERDELSLVTYRNVDGPTASILGTVSTGEGVLGQVQGTGAATQVVNRLGIRFGDREVQLAAGIEHAVIVPLRSSGVTMGVLTLARAGGERLSREEMESLSLVSAQIGAFVESRGLAQRSGEGAGMRGILDPQAFVRIMEMEMARARRYGRPLTVVNLRVAGWVQDGDLELTGRVLRGVSEVIRRNLWVADYCTYHGNGRFSLLLPDTGRDGAFAVARRLAFRIVGAEDLKGTQVDLEAAAASYPEHGDTVDELLQELQHMPLEFVQGDQADDDLMSEIWRRRVDEGGAGAEAPESETSVAREPERPEAADTEVTHTEAVHEEPAPEEPVSREAEQPAPAHTQSMDAEPVHVGLEHPEPLHEEPVTASPEPVDAGPRPEETLGYAMPDVPPAEPAPAEEREPVESERISPSGYRHVAYHEPARYPEPELPVTHAWAEERLPIEARPDAPVPPDGDAVPQEPEWSPAFQVPSFDEVDHGHVAAAADGEPPAPASSGEAPEGWSRWAWPETRQESPRPEPWSWDGWDGRRDGGAEVNGVAQPVAADEDHAPVRTPEPATYAEQPHAEQAPAVTPPVPTAGRARPVRLPGAARQWQAAADWVQDAIAETEAVLDFIDVALSHSRPLLNRTPGVEDGDGAAPGAEAGSDSARPHGHHVCEPPSDALREERSA